MLKQLSSPKNSLLPAFSSNYDINNCPTLFSYKRNGSRTTTFPSSTNNGKVLLQKLRPEGSRRPRVSCRTRCRARRRVRYDDGDDGDDDDECYGHNAEIAMLEMYSQGAKGEALLVRAMVDEKEAQILIFKGFSSSLSYETSADPTRSILPARAVIKSIDRIKGPFDPSNIQYLEKDLCWEAFKTRLQSH